MKLNGNYKNLEESYLFSTIAHKVNAYAQAHPQADILRLGIGDVTLPLAPAVIAAMQQAVAEMGKKETFRGYGPEQGYAFLRESIQSYYARRGVSLAADEIFISDGAKSDLGNILDLFDVENTVLIPDPVYPVYVDTNVMAGRRIVFADATAENGFLPMPDEGVKADIVYICSPNNPTGAAYSRGQLAAWVEYARKNGAVILYDAAYECFVCEEGLARSIYEVEGAEECAVEFCSFSKIAGFTGTRCGYTVVPNALAGGALNKMWLRRQTTKFNGVPYIVQRGAAAVFTPEGEKQIAENLAVYRRNAKRLGHPVHGRQKFAVRVAALPRVRRQLEVFRFPPRRGERRRHARLRVRQKRARVLPPDCVRRRGRDRRSRGAAEKTFGKIRVLPRAFRAGLAFFCGCGIMAVQNQSGREI